LNGDSIFNDRPALATSATAAADLHVTPWGNFDSAPAPGDPRIPMNFGTTPAQFTANLRLSKTFGIGPKLQPTADSRQPQGGQQGGQRGGDGRGPGGAGGGGRGPGPGGGGPAGGGPGGGRGPGGPGGPGGIFGGERSAQRYSLTFSANARNLFNKVNAAPPIGNLSSPQFGTSTALAGGVFNTQSANRRIDFQVIFAF